MNITCLVYELGLVPYEAAWQLQDRLAGAIAAGSRPATLLLLEHPHTYTFGRSGKLENLVWDEAERTRRGVSVHWVDRGGDVTYHGPGQLVGYPLLPLGSAGLQVNPKGDVTRLPQADYLGYLRKLETTLIAALAGLNVLSGPLPGLTGVWVQPDMLSRCRHCPPNLKQLPAKIAAIGVKVDARGVSRHGFALNVQPDMAYWEGIVGCGLKDYPVTSLAELLELAPTMQQVTQAVVASFGQIFGYEMVPGNQLEPW